MGRDRSSFLSITKNTAVHFIIQLNSLLRTHLTPLAIQFAKNIVLCIIENIRNYFKGIIRKNLLFKSRAQRYHHLLRLFMLL